MKKVALNLQSLKGDFCTRGQNLEEKKIWTSGETESDSPQCTVDRGERLCLCRKLYKSMIKKV